jgi:hypothetical protein
MPACSGFSVRSQCDLFGGEGMTALARVAPGAMLIAATALAMCVPKPASAAVSLPATKAELTALGRTHKSAWDLYKDFEKQANGGQRLKGEQLPDWSGTYTRDPPGLYFDIDQGRNPAPPAKLTPEYDKRFHDKLDRVKNKIEFDPLSNCAPPGHPRWLTEPFLREFVPTPGTTYLINEMVNDIRRIYTDGRGHIPEADRYPLYDGDSIGFWEGKRLVIHTNQLRDGQYQRSQPDYSDQVETVEIWEKVDDKHMVAHVWVYDPPSLAEPWYVKQQYTKLDDPDRELRIRYWDCRENQNNDVIQTDTGSSQFRDFTFDKAVPKPPTPATSR